MTDLHFSHVAYISSGVRICLYDRHILPVQQSEALLFGSPISERSVIEVDFTP